MQVMTKKKTSLNIDEQFWTKWVIYVVTKTGTTRKVSAETQKALEEYMRKQEEKKQWSENAATTWRVAQDYTAAQMVN